MRTVTVLVWMPLALAACQSSDSRSPAGGDPAGARLAHGETLYRLHCAVCHGPAGRADGEAARFLFPPVRDFGSGRFRLVSSSNGAPFERDVLATLRRGIPGTAMPAWGWIEEDELEVLSEFVLFLARQGLVEDLETAALRAGDDLALARARDAAAQRSTPDHEQEEPLPLPADPPARQRGRALFRELCADCHGEDGRGRDEPSFAEDGSLEWARDLGAGFLKGGRSPFELACRIRSGMPGSAMPPIQLERTDEAALLAFLHELVPPGASERLVHRRRTLHARRASSLPAEPAAEAWAAAEEIPVVLAPLWWHADAVLAARIAALHDGERVAIRLSWLDATGVVQLFAGPVPTDAAALQLSAARSPALFGMGAADEPTNLWHWQALRLEDVAGALELLDPTPHLVPPAWPGDVRTDVPRYQRLLARPDPSERVDRITVEGVQTISSASRNPGEVQASARWEAGGWRVVFVRPLRATSTELVDLRPGASVQLACAVWNGAAGDGGARKSISIWQELMLEP